MPGVRREMLGKVLSDRSLLIGNAAEIDHRAGELLPAVARVAGALGDHVGLMAPGADGLDQLLARAVRQRRWLGLGVCGDWSQHGYGSDKSCLDCPGHFL